MRQGDPSPVTSGDIFEVFTMLSEKIDTKHASMRETVEDLYHKIGVRMDQHDREDRTVADRVLRIEENRAAEHAEALRNEARRLRESRWAGTRPCQQLMPSGGPSCRRAQPPTGTGGRGRSRKRSKKTCGGSMGGWGR